MLHGGENRALEKPALPLWQRMALLFLGYFLFAWFSRFLSGESGTMVNYWLPGGWFVALLLLSPTRDWPWLMLSAVPANALFDVLHDARPDFGVIGGFCFANVIEAGVGAWLVRKFVAKTPTFTSLKEFFGLIFFAGIIGAAIAATIGASMLGYYHLSNSFVGSWKLMWGGDAMAVLVLTPMVLAFYNEGKTTLQKLAQPHRIAEALLISGGVAGFLWQVLVYGGGVNSPKVPALIFVLWAGVRFGLCGATAVIFLLTTESAFLTTHYHRGLATTDLNNGDYAFTLQIFVTVAALVGIVPPIVLGERDRTLAKLRESESRFRTLTESAFEGIFISEDGIVLDANDQGCKMLGRERHEVIGIHIIDFVAPAWREIALERIRTGATTIYGHELVRKDGTIFIAEAQAQVIRTESGRMRRLTAVRDVTERIRAEQALRESEEKFSKAFRASPDGLSISEVETGRFVEVNEGYCRLYGYSREEMIGRTSVELGIWHDPQERARLIDQLMATGVVHDYELRMLTRAGDQKIIHFSAETMELGGRTCFISVLHDVTGRVKAEEALRESEEKFSKAFRTSPDVMSITDSETGRYIDVNAAHENTYGYTRMEVIGRTPLELGIQTDPDVREKLRLDPTTRPSIRDIEIETRTRDHRVLIMMQSAEVVELGGRSCVLRVSHDITERKRIEELNRQQMQVLEMIANGCPLEETLITLLRMVEVQSPDMLTSIQLFDADAQHLARCISPSLPPEFTAAYTGLAIGPSAGSCGTAAWRREPVYVSDIAHDPLWADYKDLALPHGLRACWSTPFFDAEKNLLGTFAIYYRHTGLPEERHRQLIHVATHTAAICIGKQRVEAERTQANERLQTIFQNTTDCAFLVRITPEGQFIYEAFNPASERASGLSQAQVFGRRPEEVCPPEVALQWTANYQRCVQAGKTINYEDKIAFATSQGMRIFDTFLVPIRDTQGRISRIAGFARDVTEIRQAEDDRAQSIEREQQARIEYTLRLIATQEAERKRIAAELHDSLGQNLLLVKNLAQMAMRQVEPAAAYEQLGNISHLAAQCITEVRQISRDLHPPQLELLGLKRSLEILLENTAAASDKKFDWKFDDTGKIFSAEAAMNLYRIVQESLNNILKHSRAKNVHVTLECDVHEVQLTIADDGCGFTPGRNGSAKRGMGLQNMTERVRMLGGKFTLDSAPNRGTRLTVAIPLPDPAA